MIFTYRIDLTMTKNTNNNQYNNQYNTDNDDKLMLDHIFPFDVLTVIFGNLTMGEFKQKQTIVSKMYRDQLKYYITKCDTLIDKTDYQLKNIIKSFPNIRLVLKYTKAYTYPYVSDINVLKNVFSIDFSNTYINDVSRYINVSELNLSCCSNIRDISMLGNVGVVNISCCYNIEKFCDPKNTIRYNKSIFNIQKVQYLTEKELRRNLLIDYPDMDDPDDIDDMYDSDMDNTDDDDMNDLDDRYNINIYNDYSLYDDDYILYD
jgi:hypothetical protein